MPALNNDPFAGLVMMSMRRNPSPVHEPVSALGYKPRSGSMREKGLKAFANKSAMSAQDLSKAIDISFDSATNLIHALLRQGTLERVPEKRECVTVMQHSLVRYGVKNNADISGCIKGGNTWRMHQYIKANGPCTINTLSKELGIAPNRVQAIVHVMRGIFCGQGELKAQVPRTYQETLYRLKKVGGA